MAKCATCGTGILFGGKNRGKHRFCNDRCLQNGILIEVLDQVPPEVINTHLNQVHQGNCPRCQGQGPIDVHTSHQIWSALVLSSWKSRPQVCCRKCGIKAKAQDGFFSFFLGWWGFPWGIIMTPIQVGRNIVGIFTTPNPAVPSKALERIVGLDVAARVLEAKSQASVPPLPK